MTDASLRIGFAVWPHASLAALLSGCDVLVCSASLSGAAGLVSEALTALDPTERERFERYENHEVARRFAIGRLRLREMLGAVLAIPAAAVPIRLGLHGKPALARTAQASGVRFSVAHCDELLLVAITRLGEVGVDVERVRPIERWARMADRVFGPNDRAEIGREIASGDEPSTVFFRFWCRGEAELKAIGSGISGLSARRDGWHPIGLRVAELSAVPLPDDLVADGVRYEAAVAVCASRESGAFPRIADPSQARTPRITPTNASTA
ncbi:MAG TPA: 4'-phosphopantetheinyl transferase superfamily protein [Gemmatimonadaceae bacterium]|nr:4'-phosphopantetheinyl transferase superfamily protein [Gemmatimonadaceae bacterium]